MRHGPARLPIHYRSTSVLDARELTQFLPNPVRLTQHDDDADEGGLTHRDAQSRRAIADAVTKKFVSRHRCSVVAFCSGERG